MLNAVRALSAPVFLLCIFAAVVAVTVAQSDGDGREVVQASEILEKIEKGEPVNYDNRVIEGNINIRDPKDLDISMKEIRSQISIQYCLIKSEVDFSNVLFGESVSFNNSTFLARANFNNSFFNKNAKFDGVRFNNGGNFTQALFFRDACFSWARFNQDAKFMDAGFVGNLDFGDANFNHIADFSRAIHIKFANFHGVSFNGTANFQGANFMHGSFSDAVFNGTADFSNVLFRSTFDFANAVFNGTAFFIRADFNNTSFAGTQFYQDANFTISQFRGYTSFSGAQFNHSAFFIRAKFEKDAIFDWSYLKSADFNQTAISGDLSLKGSQIDSLDLSDAELSEIILRSWKSIGHMEYDEMAYQLLLSSFRNRNLPDEANQCYYDYREGRRATLSMLRQPADYALMLFYGYGVKPERPVIWAFVFMAIFGALFWWRQGIIPVQKGEPEEKANRFTLLEAAAFSAMTFLSGGKLVFDPPEYRIAPGKPWRDVQICKALFVWERLMGMMLLFMFAVAVTKTIILGS